MANILVVYYSSYGHIEIMARAQAEGAAGVPGTQVVVKRVPELTPRDVAAAAGSTRSAGADRRTRQLANHAAVLFGTPTRFGNMAAMRKLLIKLARCGRPTLVGKVGVFAALPVNTATGDDDHLVSAPFHHGMIIVGLPYNRDGITTTWKSPAARHGGQLRDRFRQRARSPPI
jgi:NAD(P)H dehydrogenase (quinone)